MENSMITDWENKKVAIVGLGVEGLASARFLRKKGADVWILDRKKREDIVQELLAEIEELGCHGIWGKDYLQSLSDFAVIVRSPGVKRSTAVFIAAQENGAIITSQTKLFFDLCPCPIIGVT